MSTTGKIYSVRGGYQLAVDRGCQTQYWGPYATRKAAVSAAEEIGLVAELAPRGDGRIYLSQKPD